MIGTYGGKQNPTGQWGITFDPRSKSEQWATRQPATKSARQQQCDVPGRSTSVSKSAIKFHFTPSASHVVRPLAHRQCPGPPFGKHAGGSRGTTSPSPKTFLVSLLGDGDSLRCSQPYLSDRFDPSLSTKLPNMGKLRSRYLMIRCTPITLLNPSVQIDFIRNTFILHNPSPSSSPPTRSAV